MTNGSSLLGQLSLKTSDLGVYELIDPLFCVTC